MLNKKFLIRQNKFKNKYCQCKSGHNHQSIGEARYCDQLLIEKKAGLIKDYEVQKNFKLKVKCNLITTHRVDFYITKNDDEEEVREYKGCETEVWKIKHKLFLALFPDIKYLIVKG
jgi:hypothetical protein